MKDLTFFLLIALMIFIYSCAKIVLRHLKERQIMSSGTSSNAMLDLYVKEVEASVQRRQTSLIRISGALLGIGIGFLVSIPIIKCGLGESMDSGLSFASSFVLVGCIMVFSGTCILLGGILNKILDKRK